MTASPMNFSTAPPWRSRAARAASKYRDWIRCQASGSRRSPSAVEPARSAKRTVTVLRMSRAYSEGGASRAGGGSTGGGAFACATAGARSCASWQRTAWWSSRRPGPGSIPSSSTRSRRRLLVDGERLRLATRAVEGEHELSAEALPQRLGGHERVELGHELGVTSEREVGLDPHLEAGKPKLLQPSDRRLRKRLVTDVGEGGPAPELKGLAEHGGRSSRVASRERLPTLPEQTLEATGIDRFRREIQHVPGRHRADDVGPERLAQARDGDRERAPRPQARPEVLDQPIARQQLARPKRKQNKQCTRLPAREGDLASAVVLDLERAEQTDVNHCQRIENGLKEPPCIVTLVTKRRKGRCVMGRKLFRSRSLIAVALVAALAAPAGHAASGIGNPASAAQTTGESRPALTPEQCAALPAVLRTQTRACLQGEPGVGASAVETTANQLRPARPLLFGGLSLAPRTAPAHAASPLADSFDWLDAGIGGSVGIAAFVLVLAAAGVVRSRRLAHS